MTAAEEFLKCVDHSRATRQFFARDCWSVIIFIIVALTFTVLAFEISHVLHCLRVARDRFANLVTEPGRCIVDSLEIKGDFNHPDEFPQHS